MADTTARTLQLLDLLQSAHLRTVAELAERLGVDERTVRRDVARLINAGVPVEAMRGRYGGYCLAAGQRVLPLMFSGAEAAAVFLGLSGVQEASLEPQLPVQTALAKIKRALPAADAARIDALSGVMAQAPQSGAGAPDPAVMLTLAEAVNRRKAVDLRYLSGDGVPSRRTVHPYGLAAHSGRWYLVAFDPDKQAERTFRVDRIRTARPVAGTFTPPQEPDMAGRLIGLFADADYAWRVVLRIRATEDHIRAHLPPSVARLERREAEPCPEPARTLPLHVAEIRARNLDWLPPVIAALNCEVEVDCPDELRELVRAAAARMLRAAGGVP